MSGAALAAPGDIHRVTGAELVNLRAGPSDESNIRGSVRAGDEVIGLTRDGNWIGARVLPTGEEGWIRAACWNGSPRAACCPAMGR